MGSADQSEAVGVSLSQFIQSVSDFFAVNCKHFSLERKMLNKYIHYENFALHF